MAGIMSTLPRLYKTICELKPGNCRFQLTTGGIASHIIRKSLSEHRMNLAKLNPGNPDQLKLCKFQYLAVATAFASLSLIAIVTDFRFNAIIILIGAVGAFYFGSVLSDLDRLSTIEMEKLVRAIASHPEIQIEVADMINSNGAIYKYQMKALNVKILESRREQAFNSLAQPFPKFEIETAGSDSTPDKMTHDYTDVQVPAESSPETPGYELEPKGKKSDGEDH